MRKELLESFVGFLVLLISLIAFIYFFQNTSNKTMSNGYELKATFQNIEGIYIGSRVKMSGISIGYVKKIELNRKNFQAMLVFKITDNVQIPIDSQAEVLSESLLGNRFVSISPGYENKYLKNGQEIGKTQDSVLIENLINKFVTSGKD